MSLELAECESLFVCLFVCLCVLVFVRSYFPLTPTTCVHNVSVCLCVLVFVCLFVVCVFVCLFVCLFVCSSGRTIRVQCVYKVVRTNFQFQWHSGHTTVPLTPYHLSLVHNVSPLSIILTPSMPLTRHISTNT